MTVHIEDQAVTIGANDERTASQTSTYSGFQVPFSERRVLLVVVDAAIVVLAVFGALLLWHGTTNSSLDIVTQISSNLHWFPLVLASWWVVAWLNDLYYIPATSDGTTSAVRVTAIGIASLVIYLGVVPFIPDNLPRVVFLYFLILAWAAITFWRLSYATLFSRSEHRVLIVGRGKRGQSLARALEQASYHYRVLGYVDDNPARSRTGGDDLPVLGKPADLLDLVRQFQVHEVVVAIDRNLRTNLFEWLVECQANGVQVSLMSDLYEKLHRKIPVEHIDPSWAMHAMRGRPVFSRLDLGLKRVMDLVLAGFALPLLGVLVPVIGLAIRLDSSGPIFYRQVRSGRAGKPFHIVKFRTMCTDAEKDGKVRWATEDDPRITSVGRILRKTRLDELPQIFNVLQGDMSIVGPRPERPEFIEDLQHNVPFYRTRLMIKPGLTGWAQINYPYGNSLNDALIKLQYDMYYLHHWSFRLDLYIIFRTVGVIFRFKGT